MSGPLSGIRIIELATMIAVPGATHLLATQGAEVIKVEDPVRGDELRHYGSEKGGMSAWFINANSGKRSIALDLQHEDGKSVLWRLLETADVVMQGFRPGVIGRLGFDSETVRDRLPAIVYCSSSGFGPHGPYAQLPVYDPVIQALSGWAGAQRYDEGPRLVRGMVADKVAALTSAQAVTAALLQRSMTGRGLHVELSMLEANIAFNWSDVMMHASLLDADATHRPNLLSSYRLFPCRDGWVTVTAGTDAQWRAFSQALERPELAEDARFVTASARAGHVADWYEAMGEAVAAFRLQEVLDRLRTADVPVAPVLDPTEVAEDPQVLAAGLLREVDHPVAGRLRQPRPSAEIFGSSQDLIPAPTHGQHTAQVLAEIGNDEGAIGRLAADGVVKVD